MGLKGAIFDMDGTLVDSLHFWPTEWKKIGKTFLNDPSFAPDAVLDAKFRTMRLEECALFIRSTFHIPLSEQEMLDFFNCSLMDFYQEHTSLKKGAVACLEGLQSAGIKMCIASATDAPTVKKVLSLFSIDKYFVDVVSCCDADVCAGKDSPAVYQKALRCLKTSVAQTVVFEDSPLALETAKKLGLSTVGIYDKNNYGHDRLRALSDFYISEGMSLSDALSFL